MLIATWIVNGILAALMLLSGGMKALSAPEKLKEKGMGWIDDFPGGFSRFIGIVEVLGALGLILPLATGIAPILTPLAAVGLVIIMAGATVVHLRRKEPFVPPLVITLIAVASAALSFAVVLG